MKTLRLFFLASLMLSILIPVYNCDISSLVYALSHQVQILSQPVQILCLDDGSDAEWRAQNRSIKNLPSVEYQELAQNIGRSRIRNRLASMARYRFLVFLDGDSLIIRDDFVMRYLQNAEENCVICGSRIYPDKCPGTEYRLHWTYGIEREQHARAIFQSNNFLIDGLLFNQVLFCESLEGYGHEDTLFGYQLSLHQVSVRYIDNPVLHSKLEKAEEFIRNQHHALKNLFELTKKYPTLKTRLLRTVDRLDRLAISKILVYFFRLSQNQMLVNLKGSNPRMTLLDLYKLGTYLTIRDRLSK